MAAITFNNNRLNNAQVNAARFLSPDETLAELGKSTLDAFNGLKNAKNPFDLVKIGSKLKNDFEAILGGKDPNLVYALSNGKPSIGTIGGATLALGLYAKVMQAGINLSTGQNVDLAAGLFQGALNLAIGQNNLLSNANFRTRGNIGTFQRVGALIDGLS